MIYLDSSAIVKLVHAEAETPQLRAWMAANGGLPVVSSVLARIEVVRACRRWGEEALTAARELLAGLDTIPFDEPQAFSASEVGVDSLRSLDAVHLAAALSVREHLLTLCAYDRRLLQAARGAGLPTAAPGME